MGIRANRVTAIDDKTIIRGRLISCTPHMGIVGILVLA
jgi:hypothetical protein